MHQLRFVAPLGGNAGRAQSLDIETRVIAQWIEIGRDRKCRSKTAVIVGAQRHELRIMLERRCIAAGIELAVVLAIRCAQQRRVGTLYERATILRTAEERVDEHLAGRLWLA